MLSYRRSSCRRNRTGDALLWAFLLLGAGASCPAAADEVAAEVGHRVRVATPLEPHAIVGTLQAADADTLSIVLEGRREARLVARRDLTRLEKSVHRGRKGTGALIGLGLGFMVGYAAASALGNCSEMPGVVDHCADPILGSIYGGAAGLLGAGIGALAAPGEKWAEVPTRTREDRDGDTRERLRVGVRPILGGRRGLRLVVSWP